MSGLGRMPDDLRGGMPQEVGVSERRPDAIDRAGGNARCDELPARERLRLGDELLAVERRFEAAAQRLLDAFVEFIEERRLP
jgi:hypothetical protein